MGIMCFCVKDSELIIKQVRNGQFESKININKEGEEIKQTKGENVKKEKKNSIRITNITKLFSKIIYLLTKLMNKQIVNAN